MKKIAIHFSDNTCPVCSGIIRDFDYFGNPLSKNSRKDIRYSKCTRCDTEYLNVYDDGEFSYRPKQDIINKFKSSYVEM